MCAPTRRASLILLPVRNAQYLSIRLIDFSFSHTTQPAVWKRTRDIPHIVHQPSMEGPFILETFTVNRKPHRFSNLNRRFFVWHKAMLWYNLMFSLFVVKFSLSSEYGRGANHQCKCKREATFETIHALDPSR